MAPRLAYRLSALVAVVALLVGASLPVAATSAVSTTTVSATVPTATSLDVTACTPAATQATSFGTVLPGAGYVTAADCRVVFGSSNAVASLRVRQSDGAGKAMWGPPLGVHDTGWAAGAGVAQVQTVPGTGVDYPQATITQPGGKVLLAGNCGSPTKLWCVTRLTVAGQLDATFGTAGVTALAVGAGTSSSSPAAIALDPRGRILVMGTCVQAGHDLCVTRLTSDGIRDDTYGNNGSFIAEPAPVGGAGNFGYAFTVRPDGSVLAVGDCNVSPWAGCIVAIDHNGRLDRSFGSDGWTIAADPAAAAGDQTMFAVKVLRSGSILMAGECGSTFLLCVARLTPAGAIDTTFGVSGWQTLDLGLQAGGRDQASAIHEDASGRIVVGGTCTGTSGTVDSCMTRLTANGQLDTTFGSGGSVVAPVGAEHDFTATMLELPDGYVLGGTCTTANPAANPCAVKIRTNGSVDTTFGSGGAIVVPVANGRTFVIGSSRPYSGMTYGVDGSLVIAAACSSTTIAEPDMCAVRLDSGRTIGDFGDPGASWATGETSFGACLRATSAVAAWSSTGSCAVGAGAVWRGMTATDSTIATSAGTNQTGLTADLRFGLNLAANVAPGSLMAPLTFSVVAP